MGFFTRTVHVNVHGSQTNRLISDDGRYDKQVKRNKKFEKKKLRKMQFEPHSARELRKYIEEKYHVSELSEFDERVKAVYPGIKAHLAEEFADAELKSWDLNTRFKEAQEIPASILPMHLHVYSIPVTVNDLTLAWLEVYIENDHDYLAFKIVKLEYEEHYVIQQTIRDIVNYFGISKQDKKTKNERYIQFISVQ